MNESDYNRLADHWLATAMDALEEADASGDLDLECQGGMLNITTNSGKTLLVSKHAPSRQLWFASPLSGGLHFDYQAENRWALPDGRTLGAVLSQELKTISNLTVMLP